MEKFWCYGLDCRLGFRFKDFKQDNCGQSSQDVYLLAMLCHVHLSGQVGMMSFCKSNLCALFLASISA